MSTRKGRGFTLAEVIVLIVVIAVALAGVMLVFSNAVRGTADPLVYRQALAIAEGLLDEIQLSSYAAQPGTDTAPSRAGYDDVLDYNNYTTVGGIKDINGNPVVGLSAYDISPVTVTNPGLNGVGEAFLITVSVTGPNNVVITLRGYRVNYP